MRLQTRDMCPRPQFYKSTFFYFVFIPLLRAAEIAIWRRFFPSNSTTHAQNQNANSSSALIVSFTEIFSMRLQTRDMFPQFYKSAHFLFNFYSASTGHQICNLGTIFPSNSTTHAQNQNAIFSSALIMSHCHHR
jgi:hypothetical protein